MKVIELKKIKEIINTFKFSRFDAKNDWVRTDLIGLIEKDVQEVGDE